MTFSIRKIKNKNKAIILLIFILLLNTSNEKELRIPFKTEIYSDIPTNIISDKEIKNYIMNLIRKNIYIELEVGTPPQKIKSYLKLEEFPFFIHGKDISLTDYNETKSLTYKSELYPHVFLDGEEQIKWGYVSNDTIKIKNIEKSIIGFNFILVTETKSESPSNIGLMIPNQYSSIPEISFINQLKKLEIINDYSFVINYTSYEKGEGEFILGGAPHFYDNKYNRNYYKTSYAINKPKYMMYGLEFNSINYGNNKTNIGGSMQCKFLSDFGLIAGTNSYYEFILEKFFDDKIKNEICFIDQLKINIEWREGIKKFEYIYCIKNKVDISKMENIKFIHNKMNYTFEFNYTELFDEIDNYYIFKIIFPKSSNFYWMFGKPWLAKYLMVFDQDKKTIGHYCHVEENLENLENIKKENNILIYVIISIIFLILLIGSILIIYYCLKKDNRKKRLNEINEDYEYSQENNNTEDLINKKLGLND